MVMVKKNCCVDQNLSSTPLLACWSKFWVHSSTIFHRVFKAPRKKLPQNHHHNIMAIQATILLWKFGFAEQITQKFNDNTLFINFHSPLTARGAHSPFWCFISKFWQVLMSRQAYNIHIAVVIREHPTLMTIFITRANIPIKHCCNQCCHNCLTITLLWPVPHPQQDVHVVMTSLVLSAINYLQTYYCPEVHVARMSILCIMISYSTKFQRQKPPSHFWREIKGWNKNPISGQQCKSGKYRHLVPITPMKHLPIKLIDLCVTFRRGLIRQAW